MADAGRQPKPIFVENARASRLLPPDLVEELALRSYVAMPLLSATRPLGLVLLQPLQAPRPWATRSGGWSSSSCSKARSWSRTPLLRAIEQERIDELSDQAFHDSLTELPNRALFADRLEHAFARMNRRKAAVAVLFLDLDEFKPINDNFGHDAGDRLLVAVATALKACCGPRTRSRASAATSSRC